MQAEIGVTHVVVVRGVDLCCLRRDGNEKTENPVRKLFWVTGAVANVGALGYVIGFVFYDV